MDETQQRHVHAAVVGQERGFLKAESPQVGEASRAEELVSPIVGHEGDHTMVEEDREEEGMEEGDDLYGEDEDGFGPDLNREEVWNELERQGRHEELDEDGFGPDLNREEVWKELERRGGGVIATKRKEGSNQRGLSQDKATGNRKSDPPVAIAPRSERIDESQEEEHGLREAKGLPSPQRVSRREREEHMRTHTPFRSWCEHCKRKR